MRKTDLLWVVLDLSLFRKSTTEENNDTRDGFGTCERVRVPVRTRSSYSRWSEHPIYGVSVKEERQNDR